jgi:ADP-heptose:LPS heptosyltransferase
MKKALVIRCGAFGDMIIVSPVFRALKELGYKTYVYTGDRGLTVLRNNPYIDEFIKYEKESEDNPNIQGDWDNVKNKIKPDWFRNFSESIEVNLALHPRSPIYIYPKNERRARCNKNYYDETEKWAGICLQRKGKILPDLHFTEGELTDAKKHLDDKKFNIVWCLSGSGANKAYPWADYVMGEILKSNADVRFITTGDEKCQLIETMSDKNILNLSGRIDFRATMALTRVCQLVVSPDTGVLHAAGSCSVPKIGILGHTTIENITKHFINDYSLDVDSSQAQCGPCFRLIYNHKIQCPVDNLSGAAWCMSHGQPQDRLKQQITRVISEQGKTKRCEDSGRKVSCLR